MENIYREKLEALGLSIESEFVPFHLSRNKAESVPSLNWLTKIYLNGKLVWSGPYMQGIGHAPSAMGPRNEQLTEANSGKNYNTGKDLDKPTLEEVMYCLGLDAQSGSMKYLDFCSDFGYAPSDEKASRIWNACVKVYESFGDDLLWKINEIMDGY